MVLSNAEKQALQRAKAQARINYPVSGEAKAALVSIAERRNMSLRAALEDVLIAAAKQ